MEPDDDDDHAAAFNDDIQADDLLWFCENVEWSKEEEEEKRLRMDAHLMFPFPFIPPFALPL